MEWFTPMARMRSCFDVYRMQLVLSRTLAVCCGTLLFGVATTVPVSTQPQFRGTTGGSTLAQGWAALESDRADEAATVALQLLELSPSSHGAVLLYLSALGQGADPAMALDAYDTWRSRHQGEDPHLLRAVGEGVLKRLAFHETERALRISAAEELVRQRALGGTQALNALSPGGTDAAVLAARARVGDHSAAQALFGSLDKLAGSAKVDMVRALSHSGVAPFPAFERLARDADEMVRIAAIEGLRTHNDPATIALLNNLLGDPVPFVRQAAALALVSRGEPGGEAMATAMLASGIPDVVLTAAEALPNQPERWRDAVEGLLRTAEPIDRLRASRLLAPMQSVEAEGEIVANLAHENPAIREEAARAAAAVRLKVASETLRDMLRDRSGWVKLAAARILMSRGAGLQ